MRNCSGVFNVANVSICSRRSNGIRLCTEHLFALTQRHSHQHEPQRKPAERGIGIAL